MQIIEIIKHFDNSLITALIGFCGVLIGTFISCGTTWLLDWLKYNREEQRYFKRKKEEVYISICTMIYKLTSSNGFCINKFNQEEYTEQILNITVNLEIYASKRVYDYFAKNVIKELSKENNYNVSNETLTNFINLIKEDLKLKGWN